MPHVACYIRQSSEEAGKRDLSCPAQYERFLADVARRQAGGEEITHEVAPWDQGQSGGAMDRPGLQWLLTNLERFDEVWVYDHDRLVRHAFFGPYIMHELRSRHIRLWVSQGGSDDASPMARFITDMRMRFGAYYREEIGETAKRTRDFRLGQGLWSGHAPTGYKFVYEAGEHSRRILVPNPDTAPRVQALFKMMAEGHSQKEACRTLGVGESTFIWQRDNPLYIGLVYKHRENIDALKVRSYDTFWNLARDPAVEWIYPGRHEALIDQPTWDAVERRRQQSTRNKTSQKMALSGCFRCETCGGSLRIRANHGWPTLRCERCRWEKSYRQAEATVIAALSLLTESEDFERAVEAELARPADVDRTVLDNLLLERSKVIRQVEKAVDLLMEEDELRGGLRERARALQRRKNALDKEIAREQARIASQPTVVRHWRDARALVDMLPITLLWGQATLFEKRELVKAVFQRILASPDRCTFYPTGLDVAMELEWCYPHPQEATTGIEPV